MCPFGWKAIPLNHPSCGEAQAFLLGLLHRSGPVGSTGELVPKAFLESCGRLYGCVAAALTGARTSL